MNEKPNAAPDTEAIMALAERLVVSDANPDRERLRAAVERVIRERDLGWMHVRTGMDTERAALIRAERAEQEAAALRELLGEARWLLGHAVTRESVDEWQRRKFDWRARIDAALA